MSTENHNATDTPVADDEDVVRLEIIGDEDSEMPDTGQTPAAENETQAEAELPPLTAADEQRADDVAAAVMGSDEISGQLSHDVQLTVRQRKAEQALLMGRVTSEIIDEVFEGLEAMANELHEPVTLGDRDQQYRLTSFFEIRRRQLTEAIDELTTLREQIWPKRAEGEDDSLRFDDIVQRIARSDMANGLYARLFLPVVNGRLIRYKDHQPDDHLEAMDDLTMGQRLGAIYFFITRSRLFSARAIRSFLVEFTRRGMAS